jgi:hypothetical protein
MPEFKAVPGEFARRTARRVFVEIGLLIGVLALLFSGVVHGVPPWVPLAVGAGGLLYILGGLAFYPKARSIAQRFHVTLLEDTLTFSGGHRAIPYTDLMLANVKRRGGRVSEIQLRSAFGQTIRLRGLERMDELYECLEKRVRQHARK